MLSASESQPHWQTTVALPAPLCDWLVSDRLMTPDIQRSFEDAVRIDVLEEGRATMPVDVAALTGDLPGEDWLRSVRIYSGDSELVQAWCYAPARTLATHSWLRQLGDRPLGGELALRDDVARVSKHFCPSDQLPEMGADAPAGAWCRRSVFDIGGLPLILFEHLAPVFGSVVRQTGA